MSESPKWQCDIYYKAVPYVPKETLLRVLHAFDDILINHSQRAMELFKQGYNCAQSVFAAFCEDLGIDFETALKLSSSFGGGMGGGAIDIFNEKGIEVITGASGDAETAVNSYLQGKLKSTGSVCHEHRHAHECGK